MQNAAKIATSQHLSCEAFLHILRLNPDRGQDRFLLWETFRKLPALYSKDKQQNIVFAVFTPDTATHFFSLCVRPSCQWHSTLFLSRKVRQKSSVYNFPHSKQDDAIFPIFFFSFCQIFSVHCITRKNKETLGWLGNLFGSNCFQQVEFVISKRF
jgi:hypothetical protein